MRSFIIGDIKKFMNLLLATPAFEDFELLECTVKKYVTYTIDGHTDPSFFKDSDAPKDTSTVSWAHIRPECLELIKGKNTPLYMKFILQKEPGTLAGLTSTEGLSSLLINIIFNENGLSLTTAVNFSGFYPESEAPAAWDEYIETLLRKLDVL